MRPTWANGAVEDAAFRTSKVTTPFGGRFHDTGYAVASAETDPTDAPARYADRHRPIGMFGTIPGMPVPVTTTYGLTPCAAVAVCVPMTPQRKYARPPTPLYVRFAV